MWVKRRHCGCCGSMRLQIAVNGFAKVVAMSFLLLLALLFFLFTIPFQYFRSFFKNHDCFLSWAQRKIQKTIEERKTAQKNKQGKRKVEKRSKEFQRED